MERERVACLCLYFVVFLQPVHLYLSQYLFMFILKPESYTTIGLFENMLSKGGNHSICIQSRAVCTSTETVDEFTN